MGKPPQKDLSEEPYKLETKKYEKTYKIVETTWRNGKPTTNVQNGAVKGYERNFQMEGSLKVEGNEPINSREYKNKSGKRFPENKVTLTTGTETYRSPELNPGGIARASVAAGGVALTEDWNKWMNFKVQSQLASKQIAADRQARLDLFFSSNYPVPPEPKDLPKMKFELETQVGKAKAKEMMKFVEEASYAVWGKK